MFRTVSVPLSSARLDLGSQSVHYHCVEFGFDLVDTDLVDHFLGKAVRKQILCQIGRQSAGQQIEQFFVLELADRRTVRTLDVVIKYLELRYGIDTR